MNIKIKINAEYVALFVAFLAVGLTFWEGYESRSHNRKSVVPIINGYRIKNFTDDLSTLEMGIHSVGLGPARIRHFSVFFNGKRESIFSIPGYTTAYQNVIVAAKGVIEKEEAGSENSKFTLNIDESLLEANQVIAMNDKVTLLKMSSQLPQKRFRQVISVVENTLDIFVCFCSVYDDQCQVIHIGTHPELEPLVCSELKSD